jgi:hypothetical protein
MDDKELIISLLDECREYERLTDSGANRHQRREARSFLMRCRQQLLDKKKALTSEEIRSLLPESPFDYRKYFLKIISLDPPENPTTATSRKVTVGEIKEILNRCYRLSNVAHSKVKTNADGTWGGASSSEVSMAELKYAEQVELLQERCLEANLEEILKKLDKYDGQYFLELLKEKV